MLNRLQSGLAPHLTYHDAAHTVYVMDCAEFLANMENLPVHERRLVSAAALYHDTGFLIDALAHEEKSCALARTELPAFGYSSEDIVQICEMIMATKLPQSPRTHAECVVADADLYYLGTDKYKEYSEKLFHELRAFNPMLSEHHWYDIQVRFLSAHTYHTEYAKKILEPVKQRHMRQLIKPRH